MAINVSQAFHRTSANAIDDTITLTKAEMLQVNDNLMPSKYFTVCQDDGEMYLYNKSNTVDANTGKFRKFEGTKDYSELNNKPSINSVSLSGNKTTSDLGISYNDLSDKPDIPSATSDLTNDSNFITSSDVSAAGLSGDYDDLTNKPTIPTKVSDLTNDSGFISSASLSGLTDTTIGTPTDGQILTYDAETGKWVNGQAIADIEELGDIADVDLTNLQDGQIIKWDATNSKWVNDDAPSGGDAELESAVTSNLAVGAIASGTTLAQGTTFTEFVQKILITEIAPTTTFTASGSGVKEVGTSVTPTLTLTISSVGTGTPTAIKFYDGSTLLDTQSYVSGTNTYTYTMSAVTTTKTVKGVLEYKKSDNTNANVEKTVTYTFVMASYYGAVTTAPTDKAGITALTKNVKNTKAQTATFTLSNQRSCYCYPASFGDLTSIKDANNFEYLSSYTKTNVTVDEVSYNVYTLTDPVTATGFKQVYA